LIGLSAARVWQMLDGDQDSVPAVRMAISGRPPYRCSTFRFWGERLWELENWRSEQALWSCRFVSHRATSHVLPEVRRHTSRTGIRVKPNLELQSTPTSFQSSPYINPVPINGSSGRFVFGVWRGPQAPLRLGACPTGPRKDLNPPPWRPWVRFFAVSPRGVEESGFAEESWFVEIGPCHKVCFIMHLGFPARIGMCTPSTGRERFGLRCGRGLSRSVVRGVRAGSLAGTGSGSGMCGRCQSGGRRCG